MKAKRSVIVTMIMCFTMFAQAQWVNKTMTFGGLNRSYRIYVSPSYDPASPASVVMTLHGLGDNMTNFSTLGFQYIADTANIIVLVPQAVTDPYAGTAWNSGAGMSGYYPNTSVNDIGFLNALVDTTVAHYSVDPQQIYLCGFSMGGFMTQRMALQSNGKFAAFASMSGTVGSAITTFAPNRILPIAHFHGTADGTVPYTGNQFGMDVPVMINNWITSNGCGSDPDTTHFPDLVPGDSVTVDLYTYTGSVPEAEVRLYVLNGFDHNVLYQPVNDITEIMEIWLFFRSHRWLYADIPEVASSRPSLHFFPNPAQDFITLSAAEPGFVSLYNWTGQKVRATSMQGSTDLIDLRGLAAGLYILEWRSSDKTVREPLVVH